MASKHVTEKSGLHRHRIAKQSAFPDLLQASDPGGLRRMWTVQQMCILLQEAPSFPGPRLHHSALAHCSLWFPLPHHSYPLWGKVFTGSKMEVMIGPISDSFGENQMSSAPWKALANAQQIVFLSMNFSLHSHVEGTVQSELLLHLTKTQAHRRCQVHCPCGMEKKQRRGPE